MNFTIGLDSGYCESKKNSKWEQSYFRNSLSYFERFHKKCAKFMDWISREKILSKPAWFGTNLIYLLSRSIFKVCKILYALDKIVSKIWCSIYEWHSKYLKKCFKKFSLKRCFIFTIPNKHRSVIFFFSNFRLHFQQCFKRCIVYTTPVKV